MTWTIRKLKYDGREARRVEGDLLEVRPDGWHIIHFDARRHGTWKNGQPTVSPAHFIAFLSPRQPVTVWCAFDAQAARTLIHGDICMPAEIGEGTASFIDLDLDLIVEGDNPAYARDLEEFARHRVTLGYTPDIVRGAWNALRQVSESYAAAAFPFDGTAERTMALILAREANG